MIARSAIAMLAAVAVIVVGAAVPSVTAAGSAREPPDPCKLVGRRDASRALGMPIVELKLAALGPSSRTCTLRTTTLLRSVVVTVSTASSAAEAHARFAALVGEMSSRMKPTVAVAGLGDEARSIASNVYVRKGPNVLSVALIDGTVGAARIARTVALVRRALARIR